MTIKVIAALAAMFLVAAMANCGGGGSSASRIAQGGTLSWQKVSGPAGATQLSFFAVGSNNHWFVADESQGFYRSTDQGATWTQINSGLATTLGWTINVNPANGDLMATTFSGSALNANPVTFYRSSNEGASWTAIPSVSLSAATSFTGCAFATNGNVVCGGYWAPNPSSGGWVSSNGGQTTTSFGSAGLMGTSVYSLAVNPVTGDVWLGTEQMGIFRSGDNGLTWTQASPPDTNVDPVNGIRDGNIYGITFDKTGNVFFGSQGGIWKSSKTSGGYTWSNVLGNSNTSAGRGMGRDANGDLFYGHNPDSNDPVVVRCSTDDGNTWNPCDSGLPSSQVSQEFVVNPTDRKLYALIWNEVGHTGAVYRTVTPVE